MVLVCGINNNKVALISSYGLGMEVNKFFSTFDVWPNKYSVCLHSFTYWSFEILRILTLRLIRNEQCMVDVLGVFYRMISQLKVSLSFVVFLIKKIK